MNTKKQTQKNQPNNMDTDSYFGSIFFFPVSDSDTLMDSKSNSMK